MVEKENEKKKLKQTLTKSMFGRRVTAVITFVGPLDDP